jgi:hypothetical protein
MPTGISLRRDGRTPSARGRWRLGRSSRTGCDELASWYMACKPAADGQRTAAFQQGLEWRGWLEGRNTPPSPQCAVHTTPLLPTCRATHALDPMHREAPDGRGGPFPRLPAPLIGVLRVAKTAV